MASPQLWQDIRGHFFTDRGDFSKGAEIFFDAWFEVAWCCLLIALLKRPSSAINGSSIF